jgi:PAS domain S-box-containing protein
MNQTESDPYWLLFDANPQPMWVVHLESMRFLAVNEAALRHYGYTRDEFLALTLVDLRPAEDVPAFLEHMARIRAHPPAPGEVETHERRHKRKDGHVIDMEIAWSPVVFQGKSAGLVMGTDVTERRLAEHALWESEARLRAVVATAPIVVWAVDRAGVFILSEGRGLGVLGLRPGQVVGRSVFEVYRDVPEIQANVRRALEGESFADLVDVGPLTFETWCAPLRDPAGEIVGATGVATDITDRMRSEKVRRALYRITETAVSAEDMPALYAALHAIVGELMYARNFYIALYDEASRALSFPYFVDEVDPSPPQVQGLGKTITGYVFRTGRPLLCTPAVFEGLVERREVELIGGHSVDWLGVPLKTGPTAFGVMVVQSYSEGHRFTEADRDLLSFVSQHVASAIHRKRADREINEQRAFLRQVLDINPSFVFAKDRQGRFTLVNRAVAEAYGTTVEGLIGRTDEDFNPNAEEVAHFRKDDLEVMDTRSEKRISEEVITDAAGRRRWLQTVKRPIIGPDGVANQILGVATDVTERKRAEQALAQSEERYRRFFEENPAAFFISRPDGTLLDCNSAFVRLLGYASVAEARGSDVRRLYADPGVRVALLEQLEREGRITDQDVELRRLDGKPVFVRLNQVASFEGGALQELKGFLVDRTEQRLLEERLAARGVPDRDD